MDYYHNLDPIKRSRKCWRDAEIYSPKIFSRAERANLWA